LHYITYSNTHTSFTSTRIFCIRPTFTISHIQGRQKPEKDYSILVKRE